MKRAYDVRVERGNNVYAETYLVLAATDEEAIRQAKQQAAKDNGVKTDWRCTSLAERSAQVIS